MAALVQDTGVVISPQSFSEAAFLEAEAEVEVGRS